MSLFNRLNEAAMPAGLRFIVIGGNAVISHGYQRGTEDADILVDKEDRAHLLLDNGVDVRAGWVCQLFEKHGTPELYERILRLAAP